MRRLIHLAVLLFLVSSVHAQSPGGMSEADMQRMMQGMQAMQQCMARVDMAAMERLGQEGEEPVGLPGGLAEAKPILERAAQRLERMREGSATVRLAYAHAHCLYALGIVLQQAREGTGTVSNRFISVDLDCTLDDELVRGGYAREVVNRIQQRRKELALHVAEEETDLNGIDPNGDLLKGHPVLSPVAWPLAYQYPVHRMGPDYLPESAPEQPTYLVVYRDRKDEVKFLEINPVTARLINLLQENPEITGELALDQIVHEMNHPSPELVLEGLQVEVGRVHRLRRRMLRQHAVERSGEIDRVVDQRAEAPGAENLHGCPKGYRVGAARDAHQRRQRRTEGAAEDMPDGEVLSCVLEPAVCLLHLGRSQGPLDPAPLLVPLALNDDVSGAHAHRAFDHLSVATVSKAQKKEE